MRARYKLDAFLVEAGKRIPFSLRISEPEKTEGQNDYFCRVYAPALLSSEKKIFGASEMQAYELAQQFTKSMLTGKKLIDGKGHDIDLFQP